MAYPSFEQYNQAFSVHNKTLSDPELRTGTLTKNGFGMPLAISGGFALTYTISTARCKFAVRCFHRESKDLEPRYTAISRKLASLNSPYFLDFQFQPTGILVDGSGYPVVKMAWASGKTLGEFLEDNLRNPVALGNLAKALEDLAAYLQKEGIAHGDLQSGNLMVGPNGTSVQLIDYDGMFVEEIRGLGSMELGHINFQHPQRKSLNPFDASLDHFSLIALSVSIRALQFDASLWDKTNSEADAILFRANDFLDPASSSVFTLIAKNNKLTTLAKNFAAVCKSPMARTPTLADFLAGRNIPASTVFIAYSAGPAPSPTTTGQSGYLGVYTVLSATDYAACLQSVGRKVEVIGCITAVKSGRTKFDAPYAFINFGDWRGEIFKVSIWSDGLKRIKIKPDNSLVGKWVSVVGLMEPPYIGKNGKSSYSHLSITVDGTARGTMTLLTKQEALNRLAGIRKVAKDVTATATNNQQILSKIKSTSHSVPRPVNLPTASSGSSTKSSNAQVIKNIQGSQRTTVVSPPFNTTVRQTDQHSQKQLGLIKRLLKRLSRLFR